MERAKPAAWPIIRISCGSCAATFRVPARLAGKSVKCSKCSEPIRVPAPRTKRVATKKKVAPPPPPPAAEPVAAGPKSSWREYAYLVLALALIPLGFSLLGGEDDVEARFEQTLAANPEVAEAIEEKIESGELEDVDDILTLLPDGKIQGAHLPVSTKLHWLYAFLAAGAFLTLLLVMFKRDAARPAHLFSAGLFTATLGILFLVIVQWIAAFTQGYVVVGGGILTILFYIAKLIGFSYQAALDPDNGFFLSLLGFTFGVGLCEEFVKAMPLIHHYRTGKLAGGSLLGWRGACLWGLAMGVGFGVAEGVMYSSDFYNGVSTGGIYGVRFISCVALHAIWSASVGIIMLRRKDLVQGEFEWYQWIWNVIRILVVAMVLHGLYDTLLKREMNFLALLTALASFGWLAFLIERERKSPDSAPDVQIELAS